MHKGNKERLVFIQDWIYHLYQSDELVVFTGKVAQYDAKQKLYRESDVQYKFVAEDIAALANACRGDLYRVVVKEEQDPQYGYQWRIVSAERIESVEVHVVRDFLAQMRERCLTPNRRDALIKAHGAKVLDTVLADPSVLGILKASPDGERRIYCAIAEKRGFASLLAFLTKRKWDCRWAIPLYKQYGDEAILRLRTDPYLLYRHGLTSFKSADRVFLDDGGAINDPLRCHRAVMAVLRREEEQNGGAFIPRKGLRGKIAPLLADTDPNAKLSNCTISEDDISKTLDWLEECEQIHIDHVNGSADIYPSPLHHAEITAAEGLKALCQAKKLACCSAQEIDNFLAEYETPTGSQLSPAQRKAVKQMLTAPVSVITGGPGTGKTLIVRAAIDALRKLYPQAVVQCCAPTGKAADRMPAEACTIDRLVASDNWKHVNRTCKGAPDIFFVDEVSMVGVELFTKLLSVIPSGARLVLIGDQDQLPSVAAGQLLRDLIDSGVIQTTRLREVFRQEANGAILSNAEKIVQTASDEDIHLDEKGEGFAFNKHISNPHRIPRAVIQAVELVQKTGRPLKEIQVITRQRRGELGTNSLNRLLQDHFNDQEEENKLYYGGKEFRLHDRVIHTKNNYDLNVFNGEVGEVVELQHTKECALTVKYPAKTVSYAGKDLEELELAYALPAHKCQGSEYSAVIIPVAGKGNNRRSLYTAETRGKTLVLMIGLESALTAEARGETTGNRASHLALRLQKLLPPILPETEQLSFFPPAQK